MNQRLIAYGVLGFLAIGVVSIILTLIPSGESQQAGVQLPGLKPQNPLPLDNRDVEGILALAARNKHRPLVDGDGNPYYDIIKSTNIDDRYIGVEVKTLVYDPGYVIIDTGRLPSEAIVLGPRDYFSDADLAPYPDAVDEYLIGEQHTDHNEL